MPRLSFYILKQLAAPTALFALLLTAVIWLTQSLHLLDLVINRGQSAPTFLYLTILLLPSLLVILLPVAFFAGAMYALSRLNADSELVVMSAAGFSRAQLAVPVLMAAGLTMALTYLCGLYLMPLGQRLMKDKVLDIRADIGTAMFNPGEFNTPVKGLTVFIREISSAGVISGVLVHDSRNAQQPVTYLAEGGQLVQTPEGARLIMRKGTIEQSAMGGSKLSMLQFDHYVFDLDQFANRQKYTERAASERFLPELFWPGAAQVSERTRSIYLAEGHNRLASPLYCISFALIALAAITRGRRGRGAHALRLTAAALLAIGLRIAGYGLQGFVANQPIWTFLLYLLPILGAAAALAVLMGFDPEEMWHRRQVAKRAGVSGAAA